MTSLKTAMVEAFEGLVLHFFGDKIRHGSIRAVRTYIQGVRLARYSFLGLMIIAAFAAIFISGFVLTIVGLVTLLPLSPVATSLLLVALGLLLVSVTAGGFWAFMREELWLKSSRSYELMDAVLAPWPGARPPNPLEIFRTTKFATNFAPFVRAYNTAERVQAPAPPPSAPQQPSQVENSNFSPAELSMGSPLSP